MLDTKKRRKKGGRRGWNITKVSLPASVACHSLESFRPDINPCPSQPGLSPKHRLAVYLESLLRNKLVNRGELATEKLVSHKASLRAKGAPESNKHADVRRRVTADSQSDAAQEIVASQTQEQSVKSPPGLAGATSEKRRAPGASSFIQGAKSLVRSCSKSGRAG